jgi:hypothetical protein
MFYVRRLKEFTSGILKDLTYEDFMEARSLEEAIELSKLKEVETFSGSNYRIIWSHITTEKTDEAFTSVV